LTRYAIVSDIHSNLESLQHAFTLIDDADELVCLGDVVGYGPNPNECVKMVRERVKHAVLGNHDLAAVENFGVEYFNDAARAAIVSPITGLSPNRYVATAVCVEHGGAAARLRSLRLLELGAGAQREATTVSTESIASTPQITAASVSCASCGAPLADDQRYCLQCGERTAPPSSVLLGGPPSQATAVQPSAALVPPGFPPPGVPGAQGDGERRGNAVTIIAGVGVLLLAMGVGVLIGRSSASKSSAPVSPVINLATAPASPGPSTTGEAAFTSDWPAGTNGYTIQLQTLPSAGTALSAVEAGKSAATAKGAKSVGALKSEEFASLPAGNYIVYSGVYSKQAEASKALKGVKKSFPTASVIHVSTGAAKSTSGSSSTTTPAAKSGVGSSESNPAPPSVIENLHKHKGKSYEEESKNLPNVVSTG